MEALNRYYEKHHISFSFLPTQIAEQFMELENHSLRILCTGGDVLGRMKKRSYRFFNNYGPTENTVITSAIELSPEEEEDLSIGRPIDNTEVFIVDPYGAPQPVGCPGELWIGGENLAKGYINRPELNRKCFPRSKVLRRERLYRSGDLAKWSLDGRLHFLGRIDGQVKISAFRIEESRCAITSTVLPLMSSVAMLDEAMADAHPNVLNFTSSMTFRSFTFR